MPSISVTHYWGPQPPSGAGTPPSFALDAAKAREEGRSESLPLLAQRESELNDLRLHLDQRQKQVDFLNNQAAELEARLAGLSAPAAKNSRSTPR